MHKQIIYARYEYPMDKDSFAEVIDEYYELFLQEFDEQGIHIKGVSPVLDVNKNRIILLVYSKEVDTFLQLKFTSREDVKINRYTVKEENE